MERGMNRYREKEWELACEPFQMAPGVYYVGTSYVGSYLLDTGDGLILIDQAFAESVYLILENVRKLGFDPMDIKLLFVSHGHLDHCGGTRLLQEYTKAKVYMSKEDYDMMKEHPEWVYFDYENRIDFEPDEFYDNANPVELGNMKIRTVLSPGHTPGTTSFFFDVKNSRGESFLCGLHGGVGLNTLIPEFYDKWPGWPEDLRDKFKRTMRMLLEEKVDITLPSHPNQVPIMDKAGSYSEEANPFVDKEAWPKLLNARLEMADNLAGD